MRIFLSYASEDQNIADNIYLSLVKDHKVFFDHTKIKGGEDFSAKIRAEIMKCNLFIFLISPDSVSRSSYALTELNFARERWNHPEGHVLPVMIRETSYELIPPYLKAVSILEPEGNVAAGVDERVRAWRGGGSRSWTAIAGGAVIGLVAILLIVFGLNRSDYFNGANINSASTPLETNANRNPDMAVDSNTTSPITTRSTPGTDKTSPPVNKHKVEPVGNIHRTPHPPAHTPIPPAHEPPPAPAPAHRPHHTPTPPHRPEQ